MNDVSKYFYYMWNRWNEDECKAVFKDDFYPHFWNKWCDICDAYGVRGAAERFYSALSESNRDKIVERAKEIY